MDAPRYSRDCGSTTTRSTSVAGRSFSARRVGGRPRGTPRQPRPVGRARQGPSAPRQARTLAHSTRPRPYRQ
eukprot:7236921-Pyramimonas_sp.AAC.1